MPKKIIRDAFYYFMLDFKEEQRRNGVNYENMAQVADAAGPLWKNAVPAVRAKFEAIAKEEKQLKRQMDQKLTSTGVPVSFIENHEKELQAAEEFQRQDIKNIVGVKSLENTLHLHSFFIMDVNAYCQVGEEWMIGESSLLQFNLQDGILNHYHENINPGNIPMGYASDVKIGCQQLGLEMPFDEPDQRNYKERILSRIVDYITQQGTVKPEPPIYTMPNKIEKVTNFIHQLCYRSGEDESKFRVYGLPALLHSMTNALRSADNEGFPTETLALKRLERDSFKYMPKEACEHHEMLDMPVECTLSRTKRWAFMVFDSCCQLCGVDLQPGKHLPLHLHINSVIIAKEEAQQRGVRGATLGDGGDASSCNTSLDQSYGAASSISESSKPKRVHKPLRLPKTDHLQKLERPPELTLDADNFPMLGVSRGRGRGRGLSSSLGSMNINRK